MGRELKRERTENSRLWRRKDHRNEGSVEN